MVTHCLGRVDRPVVVLAKCAAPTAREASGQLLLSGFAWQWLLAFVPALVAGLIVETTGLHLDWRLWVLGFLIGMIAAAMWAGAAALFNGASWGVSASAIFGLLYPFNGSIIIGTIVHFPFPFTIFLLYGTVGGLLLGMSENIYKVIKQGKTLGAAMIIEELAIYMLVAGGLSRSVTVGVITGLAYLFGTQIGCIWATRQVPDTKTRKKLANAETPFSDSLGF